MSFGILSILSISNNMIGLNQTTQNVGKNGEVLESRRRRTPSQYAQHIIELKKLSRKTERKVKNEECPDQQSFPTQRSVTEKTQGLSCILPKTNRKIKLSVIIKKMQKTKSKPSRFILTPDIKVPQKIEQPKNQNLLEALFKLCEQHKVKQELRAKQSEMKSEQQLNSNQSNQYKGQRTRKIKQDQEKYVKMYEKYQLLTEKMQQMQNQTFII